MGIEFKDEVMKEIQIFSDKMDKTISVLKSEYIGIRAGRANPHILDKIIIDYYGTKTPINQMGNISITDARCIVITVWDSGALKLIEKAIIEANIGINPTNDGKVIRLVFPEMTEDRRKDIVKQIKKMAEDAKIALRNIRRDLLDIIKKMKTDKKLTEDELSVYEKDVEKNFIKHSEFIDAFSKEKEKEIMTL